MDFKLIGEYKHFPSCRFCGSLEVKTVIDLGYMPLAGGFIIPKTNISNEMFYPLQLNFCKKCFLLQVNASIDPDILFKNYFYFSSSIKTLVDHFENVSTDLTKTFIDPGKRFIVEIGCNDGAFISILKKKKFRALGVDPASNVVNSVSKKHLPIINSYFTKELAKKIVEKYGRADAIYSFHSMAHIENMHDVLRGIKLLLKKDGFLAMEVHYLGDLIKEVQYDMIYHEHQFYYTLISITNFFKMYDMEIFNIKKYKIRGGSIMFFVQYFGGPNKISQDVASLFKLETRNGYNKLKTYVKFAIKIKRRKEQLLKLLASIKNKKKKIIGYGASGRGTIIANYCSLNNFLDYVVDDASAKHGSLLPGTHHMIFPPSKMIRDKADYALLFAWPFFKEVKEKNKEYLKNGGRFILPLPKVRLL